MNLGRRKGGEEEDIVHNLTRAGREDDDEKESHLIFSRGESTSLSRGTGAVQPSGLGGL